MARRNRRSKTSFFALLSKTHPAVGVVCGLLAYAAIRWGGPALVLKVSASNAMLARMFTADTLARWDGHLSMVGLFALCVCWLGAICAWWSRRSRGRILDIQTGLDSIRALSWQDFERLVAEAYRRQGYRVVETGGGGADGGIDLLLHRAGKTIMVQCKQWRSKSVSAPVVREMWGLVAHHGYDGVKIVCVGDFTPDAASFARGKPMELVGGGALLLLVGLQKHGAPVRPVVRPPRSMVAHLRANQGCPDCGQSMVLRHNRAQNTRFMGCSRYPGCKGTRPLP